MLEEIKLLKYSQENCRTNTKDDFYISTKCEPIIIRGLYQFQKADCDQNEVPNYLDDNCKIPLSRFVPIVCNSPTSILSRSVSSTCQSYANKNVIKLKYNYNFGCDRDEPAQTKLYPIGECINTTLFGTFETASMIFSKKTDLNTPDLPFEGSEGSGIVTVQFYSKYGCSRKYQMVSQNIKIGKCSKVLGDDWIIESISNDFEMNRTNSFPTTFAPTFVITPTTTMNSSSPRSSPSSVNIRFIGFVNLNENSTQQNLVIAGSSVGALCGITIIFIAISLFL